MKPYYNRNGIAIYCGDCLEVMPGLDAEFDAVIADLPYGTTACSWDAVIPFEPLWREYKRLIKENGAVVLFGGQPFTTDLIASNRKWFKYEWVWSKGTISNFQLANFAPLKEHENILVFSGKPMRYNPQLKKKNAPIDKRNWSLLGKRMDRLNHFNSPPKKGAKILTHSYPRTILKFNSYQGEANGSHRLHPTQKPVELLAYLIRTYTNPGELILDNVMGSGTTLVAAQNQGRQAVGIEISEEYCKVAVDRLRQPSFFSLPTNGNVKSEPQQIKMDM